MTSAAGVRCIMSSICADAYAFPTPLMSKATISSTRKRNDPLDIGAW